MMRVREIKAIPTTMRCGVRELTRSGSYVARLEVAMSEAVPESMRAHTREIIGFYVARGNRGQRWGAALMNMVCQEADANCMTLLLTARPSDGDLGPSQAKLMEFYQRFGFFVLQETPSGPLMARQVVPRPKILQVH